MSIDKSSMLVRQASSSDTSSILELWKQLMKFHSERDSWFEMCEEGCTGFAEHIKHCLNDDRAVLLVAEVSGSIVGYCLAEMVQRQPVFCERSFAVISDLAVDEQFRRNGVGCELAGEMLRLLRDQGVERIEVTVAICNEVSTSFWHKMGFTPYMEKLYLTEKAT